jgi:hypothetical protein
MPSFKSLWAFGRNLPQQRVRALAEQRQHVKEVTLSRRASFLIAMQAQLAAAGKLSDRA